MDSFPLFAGAVLRHGSHFLFIKRSEKSRHWPHYWCFPGGKVEGGETAFGAAQREVSEEIGVQLQGKNIVSSIEIRASYSDGIREAVLFLFDLWDGMPENLEPAIHSHVSWFSLEEFPTPMIPHIEQGFHDLLAGRAFLEYDGVTLG